ncbi:MAG: trypsin-like serine peptidase [Panacagrimonas sp.]
MSIQSIVSNPEMAQKIRARIAAGDFRPTFPLLSVGKALEIFDLIVAGHPINPRLEPRAREVRALIVMTGRPSFPIRDNTYVPTGDIWRDALEAAKGVLHPAIRAVGRIEVRNHPEGWAWIGTGWLVADSVVATNRHVAREFAEPDAGGRFRFFPNPETDKFLSASIDLRKEYGLPNEEVFEVLEILHVEDRGPDIAFLKVDIPGPAWRAPIRLSAGAVAGTKVAVVGYPGCPNPQDRADADAIDEVFDGIYEVKRIAPGEIVQVDLEGHELEHDCSTLGGNSGSPVLDLASGEAVGLHFGGNSIDGNRAVSATLVRDRLRALGLA